MPINLKEIQVDMLEEDLDDTNDDIVDNLCSLCNEVLDRSRGSDYEPILHTLDICLKNLFKLGE